MIRKLIRLVGALFSLPMHIYFLPNITDIAKSKDDIQNNDGSVTIASPIL